MFAFARRLEPQRRPIDAPGISIEQYERISARLRHEPADRPAPMTRRAADRLILQPINNNEGTLQ